MYSAFSTEAVLGEAGVRITFSEELPDPLSEAALFKLGF